MADVSAIVDAYFEMWNAPSEETRRAAIERAWAPDARYTDGIADVAGHNELAAMVKGVQEQFPGTTFERTSSIDLHHDRARFGWRMVNGDGAVAMDGIDVVRIADDGRLADLVGFFGSTPAPDA